MTNSWVRGENAGEKISSVGDSGVSVDVFSYSGVSFTRLCGESLFPPKRKKTFISCKKKKKFTSRWAKKEDHLDQCA